MSRSQFSPATAVKVGLGAAMAAALFGLVPGTSLASIGLVAWVAAAACDGSSRVTHRMVCVIGAGVLAGLVPDGGKAVLAVGAAAGVAIGVATVHERFGRAVSSAAAVAALVVVFRPGSLGVAPWELAAADGLDRLALLVTASVAATWLLVSLLRTRNPGARSPADAVQLAVGGWLVLVHLVTSVWSSPAVTFAPPRMLLPALAVGMAFTVASRGARPALGVAATVAWWLGSAGACLLLLAAGTLGSHSASLGAVVVAGGGIAVLATSGRGMSREVREDFPALGPSTDSTRAKENQ